VDNWEQIVEQHGACLWRTAYRLVGNRADADDCCQEAFLAALAVARNGAVRNWSALLRRLVTTRALDVLRRRYRHGEASAATAPVEFDRLAIRDVPPIEALQASELVEALRRCLVELPERESQVFCLQCFEDLGYREIAEELGIETGTVGALLHRARSRLRRMLAAHADLES